LSDIANNQDDFTRSAGKQLALFALAAVAGITLLMLGLSWASDLTSTGGGTGDAVDPATGTVTLVLNEEGVGKALGFGQRGRVDGELLAHVDSLRTARTGDESPPAMRNGKAISS